jgi:hypothetical protein
MLTDDFLPQAYVHRTHGRAVSPPNGPNPMIESSLEVLWFMVALWPLTGTLLCAAGLLFAATEL